MDRRSITSKENGKKGGRPVGSSNKPRITDSISEEELGNIARKAVELAISGDSNMVRYILDHYWGRAPQALTGPDGEPLVLAFDAAFKAYTNPNE